MSYFCLVTVTECVWHNEDNDRMCYCCNCLKKKRVQQKLNLASCTCHASSAESNHGQLLETSDKGEFE